MEGRHFAAGPWFTVKQIDSEWQELDTIWLSDGGSEQVRARVEIKLGLADSSRPDALLGARSVLTPATAGERQE